MILCEAPRDPLQVNAWCEHQGGKCPAWGLGRPEHTLRFVEVQSMAQVYCVKCKAKKEAIDTKKVTMKNGKPALEGKCPTCGTKVFKIGG